MALHNDNGKRGEDLGASWLASNGHLILERNWRFGRLELDIITIYHNIIHFIEVKTATTLRYGFPEARINKAKRKHLSIAIASYLEKYPTHEYILTVLSVQISKHHTSYFMMPIDFIS